MVSFPPDFVGSTFGYGPAFGVAPTVALDPKPPFIRDASAGRRYDIRTIWELLGHKDVNTTMIYPLVPNNGAMVSGARSTDSEQPYTVCIRPAFGRRSLLESIDTKAISWIYLNLEHALM